MGTIKHLFLLLLCFTISNGYSQKPIGSDSQSTFELNVKVVDKTTDSLIKNARITVNGMTMKFSSINGIYKLKARVHDQLVVTHPNFETVYYTITSNEDIKIVVEGFYKNGWSRDTKKKVSSRKTMFQQYIDSAKFFKRKNIERSVSFIEKALQHSNSRQHNAEIYQTLGDVYLFWKQYDLAISNYKTALQIRDDVVVRISLGNAQFLSSEYEESEATFKEVQGYKLTSYQEVQLFEALGDLKNFQKKYVEAEQYYNNALAIAQKVKITPKITDLNSKLAGVFANNGNQPKAESLYKNSLALASKQNKKRSLREQEKVADYYNKSNRYDDEIKLRTQTLEERNAIEEDSEFKNDTINSQKINYKIGKAYILKEDYKEAIPFLEKSIEEADKEEDLVVKKDATRKLSEVYATVGAYDKALESYENYVKVVDSLYDRKEQEIQQAKQFSRKIASNQNRITSLEKDKALNQSKINLAFKEQQLVQESNKRQQLIIYSLLLVFLLMTLVLYFMQRTNKQQKLANNLLALKSMRSQMNPHFIFNALNSVNSFIAVNDERNANRYLSEFSTLMRAVLENSDEDFIPLSKEIELLSLYVKLEHNRFKDKFEYVIEVDQKIDIEQYGIPPMLLQPYIENAIWHGLRYKREKGFLQIRVQEKNNDSLLISIVDNGIGRKQSQELKTKNQLKQKSKGMSTIKQRVAILNDMYKERIAVSISDVMLTGEGTKVEVVLKKM